MRFETAHDTKMHNLLEEVYKAQDILHDAIEKTLARLGQAEYVNDRHVTNDGVAADQLPIGTFYKQAKTFTRGEGGIYMVTADGPRKAHAADIPEAEATLVNDAREALMAPTAALAEHEVAYTGWTRYLLVTNGSGHVHRDRCCPTLRPTTRVGAVVELSGLGDTEAVERLGEVMCTVCFPEAPTGNKLTKAAAQAILKGGVEAGKQITDKICPGAGTWNYDRETARTGYYTGNYGICNNCGNKATLTSMGKLRSHATA